MWIVVGFGSVGKLIFGHLKKQGIIAKVCSRKPVSVGGISIVDKDSKPSVAYTVDETDRLNLRELTPNHRAKLLICTKAYDVVDVVRQIPFSIPLVVLSNGHPAVIHQLQQAGVPSNLIKSGINSHGSLQLPGNVLRHTVASLALESLWDSSDEHDLKKLKELNVSFKSPSEMSELIWEKLAVNCAINPVCALAKQPNGWLLQTSLERARSVTSEVAAVYSAYLGAHGAATTVMANKWFETVKTVAKATASNRCSMLVDIENNRRTEIDYMNEFVSQQGKRFGIATPVNSELACAIKRLDQPNPNTSIR